MDGMASRRLAREHESPSKPLSSPLSVYHRQRIDARTHCTLLGARESAYTVNTTKLVMTYVVSTHLPPLPSTASTHACRRPSIDSTASCNLSMPLIYTYYVCIYRIPHGNRNNTTHNPSQRKTIPGPSLFRPRTPGPPRLFRAPLSAAELAHADLPAK